MAGGTCLIVQTGFGGSDASQQGAENLSRTLGSGCAVAASSARFASLDIRWQASRRCEAYVRIGSLKESCCAQALTLDQQQSACRGHTPS